MDVFTASPEVGYRTPSATLTKHQPVYKHVQHVAVHVSITDIDRTITWCKKSGSGN